MMQTKSIMSLDKYYKTISNIDSSNIYVENVRSLLNVSTFKARLYCEMAVQEKVFQKKYGVSCPNDSNIIKSYDSRELIPEEITCHICEGLEREECTFKTRKTDIIEFYQLIKR